MVLGPPTQKVGLATSNWNEISSCDASEIDSIVDGCLTKVEQEINSICLRVSEEFFETSERSETLAQWRKSTEV